MSRTNPYGFTREGANMLSAVLHTDVAIDRSIQIMRAFSAMERMRQGFAAIEIADQFEIYKRIAKSSGLKGNQVILAASKAVQKITGYDPLELLGQKLVCEEQQINLTPTALGKMMGDISAQKINKLLANAGLQEEFRDIKDRKCWKPTAKGMTFAVLTDTNKKHSDGRPVQQLMWLETVLAVLKSQPSQTEFAF